VHGWISLGFCRAWRRTGAITDGPRILCTPGCDPFHHSAWFRNPRKYVLEGIIHGMVQFPAVKIAFIVTEEEGSCREEYQRSYVLAFGEGPARSSRWSDFKRYFAIFGLRLLGLSPSDLAWVMLIPTTLRYLVLSRLS
jgi:hypothetical protein